jgi:hypothetical protein
MRKKIMKVFKFVSILAILVVAATFTKTGSYIVSGCASRVSSFIMAQTVLIRAEGALTKVKQSRENLEKESKNCATKANFHKEREEKFKDELRMNSVKFEEFNTAARLAGVKKFNSASVDDMNAVYEVCSKKMTGNEIFETLQKYKLAIKASEASIKEAVTLSARFDKHASDIDSGLPKIDNYIHELTTLIQDLRLAKELQKINNSIASIRNVLEANNGILDEIRETIDRTNAELEYLQQNQNSDELKYEINNGVLIDVLDDDDLL